MKKSGWILVCLTFVFLFLGPTAQASGNVEFSIRGILTENQIDKEQTYFDLLLKPGAKQEIKIAIKNDAAVAQKFVVNINQATTNSSGQIDYSSKKAPSAATIYPIEDVVQAPKTVTVPPQSEIQVPLSVTMPTEKFAGRIMAGIQVLKLIEEDGAAVTSQFGYILGLQLRNTLTQVKRELKITNPKAAISFGETAFSVNVENMTLDAIGKMTYTGKITEAGKKTALQKINWENRSMAPNSNFDLVFAMNDQEIKPGAYQLHLQVTDGKGNVWQVNESFTVSSKNAKEVNSAIIPVAASSQTPPWLYGLVGALAALLVLVSGVLLKSRRPQAKAIKELNS